MSDEHTNESTTAEGRPRFLEVTVGANTMLAQPTRFNSGSIGYRALDKAVINGEKYQAQLNLVKVKSKGEAWDLVD